MVAIGVRKPLDGVILKMILLFSTSPDPVNFE